MKKSNHIAIRELLRQYEDGLPVSSLATVIGTTDQSIRNALKQMPDAYVDRWSGPVRGKYAAVWCVVVPPTNCPHPTGGADA